MIVSDLTQTINIMVINQMYCRVVQLHAGLIPIQNYFQLRQSQDNEFLSLITESP